MNRTDFEQFFTPESWLWAGLGPRYLQLARHIGRAIHDGKLAEHIQLPAERIIAELAQVSRVTIRKAIAKLIEEGMVVQQQGAGSFVRHPPKEPRLEQSLSSLTSFTDSMRRRGVVSDSKVLSAETMSPAPDEMLALGLSAEDQIAVIKRIRSADGIPMAIETSYIPSDILPNPKIVGISLYEVLGRTGVAPIRALQRIGAKSLTETDAGLIGMAVGSPVLQIDRTGYLANGRPIEFTRGLYRSDVYDFVADLKLIR